MRSKQNEIRPQDGKVSLGAGDQSAPGEPAREGVQSRVAPTPGSNPTEQPINFVGIGLHLPRQRVRPRGTVERFGTRPENWRGLYYVYVVEDGVEKRVQRRPVLGPTASMSKRGAEDKLAEIIERELALPPERPRTVRFRDIWESFRSFKSGIWGKANAGNLQSIFRKHVLPALGDLEISQLTLDPLQRLLNQIARRGYRRSTLKHIRTYLKAALEYAVDEGLINRNPARKLELPKTQKSRERFYSLAEMKQLLSVAVRARESRIPHTSILRPTSSGVARPAN